MTREQAERWLKKKLEEGDANAQLLNGILEHAEEPIRAYWLDMLAEIVPGAEALGRELAEHARKESRR